MDIIWATGITIVPAVSLDVLSKLKLSQFRKLETVSVELSKIPKVQTNHNKIAKSITKGQNKEMQRWKSEAKKSKSLGFLRELS